VKAGCHSAFRSPAAQAPVGAAFGEAHAGEAKSFSIAEPSIFVGHIRFVLLKPVDIHRKLLFDDQITQL